jgi:DNA polymerase III sliding clamp (beta) subunit (PCNA family)
LKQKLTLLVLLGLALCIVSGTTASASGASEIKIQEFTTVPVQKLLDITSNPGQAGIEVTVSNGLVTLKNKNNRIILAELASGGYYARSVLVSPEGVLKINNSQNKLKAITIAYPNESSIICVGSCYFRMQWLFPPNVFNT